MPTDQETRKALVRRALKQSFDEGEPKALTKLCAPDYVHHTALREDIDGREAFVAFARELHDTFDELSFSIDSIVAEDDTVALRGTISGVHVGGFQGIPPTQEQVTWKSYVFARVEEGQLAETWVLSDAMGLLEQLDAAPEPS